VNASLLETNPRTRYEILHRTRHEYLTCFSFIGNAHTHLSCRAGHVAIDDLTLARMQTGARLHAQPRSVLGDRRSATNRTIILL